MTADRLLRALGNLAAAQARAGARLPARRAAKVLPMIARLRRAVAGDPHLAAATRDALQAVWLLHTPLHGYRLAHRKRLGSGIDTPHRAGAAEAFKRAVRMSDSLNQVASKLGRHRSTVWRQLQKLNVAGVPDATFESAPSLRRSKAMRAKRMSSPK